MLPRRVGGIARHDLLKDRPMPRISGDGTMTRVTLIQTLEDVEAARERIRGIAMRTPLVRLNVSEAADRDLPEAREPAADRLVQDPRRCERDGTPLAPEELAQGVLTASAGNMAQGVAGCARVRGIPCTVVAPETAPATKIAAIERLGGRVIKVPFERWWETFESAPLSRRRGARSSTRSTIPT